MTNAEPAEHADSASDQRVAYRVNPDRDTPEGVLEAGYTLGNWIRVADAYGNSVWFKSVEHIVQKQWVVHYPGTADKSHMVRRSTVQGKITQRWPDVSVHVDPPEDIDDD